MLTQIQILRLNSNYEIVKLINIMKDLNQLEHRIYWYIPARLMIRRPCLGLANRTKPPPAGDGYSSDWVPLVAVNNIHNFQMHEKFVPPLRIIIW